MNYYRLKQPSDISGTLIPDYPYASAIWSGKSPLLIKGSIIGQGGDVNFLPFYEATVLSNAFLISSEAWHIWTELQKGGRNRPCAFGHMKTRQIKPYRLVLPRILEALHEDTEYLIDGTIKTVCLCKSRVGRNQVFTIKGSFSSCVVISEYVLEEMLRNKITGLSYEPADLRGE